MERRSSDAEGRPPEAIELRITLVTTPSSVFRALTSQTELRTWWAPRVIISKNIVSQEEGRDVEMKLLQQDKNHSIRYSWRGLDWPKDWSATVITCEISDLGVSRGKTGEGIQLSISHDGWTDEPERTKQEEIWQKALACLKDHLEGRKVQPWWNIVKPTDGFRLVKLAAIRSFFDKLEKDIKLKPEKKLALDNVWKICQILDGKGEWFLKEAGNEFDLRAYGRKIFGFMKNGHVILNWRDLEMLVGQTLQDYAERLALEQDQELNIGKSFDKVPASLIQPELWARWCGEIIDKGKKAQ